MSILFEEHRKSAYLTNNYSNSGGKNKVNIDYWRKVRTSDSVKKDRKKWYWCPKHVCGGDYDELYITHPASKHSEWVERYDNWGKKKDDKLRDDLSTKNPSDLKLKLRESTKKVLMTTHGFSESEAQAFMTSFQDAKN